MERAMKRAGARAIALAGLIVAGWVPAATLTLDVSNLRSSQGRVMVSLCDDAKAPFPGACRAYSAMDAAKQGTLSLRIENMKPGRYAIQAFHDENGNFRPDIPGEGFAFGNDTAYPPAFDAASVQVQGDAHATIRMDYAMAGGARAAAPVASRGAAAPQGVARIDVRADGLYGELYVPEKSGPAPAMLLIGGSEGGIDVISQMATTFAQRGYATLALAYWNAPGLPQSLEEIPLEYFDRAITWLQGQPQVRRGTVGMLGWSRGAEAALLVASRNPAISAVVAVAPSGVVWQGLNYSARGAYKPAWTVQGKPLPSLVPDSTNYRPGQPLAQMFLASIAAVNARPDTAIPVEKIRGGVLLITGGDDHIQPSTRFADRIAGRLQALGFKGDVMQLDYPAAGHAVFVGDPEGLMARSSSADNPMMGGTPEANAAAWADNWPRTLAFLQKNLNQEAR